MFYVTLFCVVKWMIFEMLCIFLYSIGLAPNTVYRVTVRAKNIRAPHFDEKSSIPVERYSCHIDFRTLPKGMSPVIMF